MNHRLRSFIKAVTWRVLSVFVNGFVVWLTTKDLSIVGTIAIVDSLFKIILYYVHERVWRNRR